ncbi:MAG: hypothetical protein ACRCT7_17600 [Shewanella sp.]
MNIVRTFLLLLIAISPALHADTCSVTEDDIVGAWSQQGEQGFFEEFALTSDSNSGVKDFNSWLHHRPELVNAAWEFKDCQLIITPRSNEFPPFQLNILSLKENTLQLQDESEDLPSVYKRILN